MEIEKKVLIVGRQGDESLIELMDFVLGFKPPFQFSLTKILSEEFRSTDLRRFDCIIFLHAGFSGLSWEGVSQTLKSQQVICPLILVWANVVAMRDAVKIIPHIHAMAKPLDADEFLALFVQLCVADSLHSVAGVQVVTCPLIQPNVIVHLAQHSEELFRVSPRQFEELVAELLASKGWAVELSRIGADDGIDIIAVKQIEGGIPHQMLVQVKRFNEEKKVALSVAKELLFMTDDRRASSCMIATTSTFTRPTRNLQKAYYWKLSLKDRHDIIQWCTEYGRPLTRQLPS